MLHGTQRQIQRRRPASDGLYRVDAVVPAVLGLCFALAGNGDALRCRYADHPDDLCLILAAQIQPVNAKTLFLVPQGALCRALNNRGVPDRCSIAGGEYLHDPAVEGLADLRVRAGRAFACSLQN